jgi:hypothetical protein
VFFFFSEARKMVDQSRETGQEVTSFEDPLSSQFAKLIGVDRACLLKSFMVRC